jgi:hypothetical protein
MTPHHSIQFRVFIKICGFFSNLIAAAHFYAVRKSWLQIPTCFTNGQNSVHENLKKIWFARLLKKAVSVSVRSPFRMKALRLINFDIPAVRDSGLVIVTCHTPWKRLLVQWFYENYYAIIIDTGKAKRRLDRIKKQRKGYNQLFHIIRHLRYGGCIVIAADVFNKSNDCPSQILGKCGNLSLLPARLAKIAGVPLITAVSEIQGDRITMLEGPKYDFATQYLDCKNVMQDILGFFENEIKRDPSIWSYFVNDPLNQFHKKIIE